MRAERSGERGSGPEFDLSAVASFGQTDVGRVRSVNQDAFAEWHDGETPARLFFVADGMGGHRGGEVASQLAVEHVGAAFAESGGEPQRLLQAAFQRANSEIFGTASRDFELAGMGTTGVALLLDGASRGFVAHVGDSRAYRLRDGELEALTGDHSVVGELVRRGQLTSEEARLHPQSNEILRAIGTQPQVEVEIAEIDVQRGDRYLLCSDGLSGMLSDPDIGRVLESAPPEEAVAKLIDLANEAGGTDNITVQIVEIPATAPASVRRSEAPGPEAAAAGSMVRWAVALALLAALLLLLFGGGEPGG
jgi:protein phosphatase